MPVSETRMQIILYGIYSVRTNQDAFTAFLFVHCMYGSREMSDAACLVRMLRRASGWTAFAAKSCGEGQSKTEEGKSGVLHCDVACQVPGATTIWRRHS